MNSKRMLIKRLYRRILKITLFSIIAIMLFSINSTVSGYKTDATISSLNAIPIVSIESADNEKVIEFIDYGWATYSFDIVNGKMGKDGIFYVNEIDMEYYIQVVKDSGDLSLKLEALYMIDNSGLSDPLPYVEGKGYGPFNLGYKKDDELVYNEQLGYYESKYVSRVHYMLVYSYGTCGVGNTKCVVDIDEAGKDYKFHVDIKAVQKVKK